MQSRMATSTKIEIEIIVREIIKPSSPTPTNLRNVNLHFLDQIAPPKYVPLLLFYALNIGTNGHDQLVDVGKICHSLKTSLSKTLTLFYPYAGRINDNVSVECNDDGVDFIEARTNLTLLEILRQPDFNTLINFLPVSPNSQEATTKLLLAQATFFEGGGMAIGVCMSHKLTDAASLRTFIKTWAAATAPGSTGKVLIPPKFQSASVLPPKETIKPEAVPKLHPAKYSEQKRFVFEASMMAALKAKAASEIVKEPSRVEAVSAIIWRCAMEAARSVRGHSNSNSNNPMISTALLTANLRKSIKPALADNCIGNIVGFVRANSRDTETSLQSLVRVLREGKQELKEIVEKKIHLWNENMEHFIGSKNKKIRDGFSGLYTFTSWCRFQFYGEESDFGFGKPIWIAPLLRPGYSMDVVVLVDARDGEGVEAWVCLHEKEMELFQQKQELLAFASLNPSVII